MSRAQIETDWEPTEALPDAGPSVFSRVVATPPGWPWEQAQAARLEVRNGSPVAGDEVTIMVRRTEGWRPGRPGRFLASYVRPDASGPQLAPTKDWRGLWRDPATGAWTPLAQRSALVGAVSILLLLAVGQALGERRRSVAALEAAEAALARKAAEIGRAEALASRAAMVEAAGLEGRTVNDLLADLAWASRSRAPTARFVQVAWGEAGLTVEVRGAERPFAAGDRTATRVGPGAAAGASRWSLAAAAGSTAEASPDAG